jgi:hypothetical protein
MAKILTSLHGKLIGLLANGSLSTKGLTRDRDAVVNVTTATLTLRPQLHAGKTLTLNRAAGITVTLPAAVGDGDEYEFVVGTTFTGNGIVKVANATDTMVGSATLAQDAADTVVQFDHAAASDTITFNGTTTGGLIGATIKARDIKLDGTTPKWFVEVFSSATGAEVTPFSATV